MGKPIKEIECDENYELPIDAARNYIIYNLNGGLFEDNKQFEIYYDARRKSIVFNELLWREPYKGIQYTFSIYDENGEFIERACIIQFYLISWHPFKNKYKSGTYEVRFDDFPEVTKKHFFIKPSKNK